MNKIPLAYRMRAAAGTFLRRRMRRARREFLAAARVGCRDNQQAVLRGLLQLNHDSQFSRDRRLSSGMSLSEFRSAVPVADYELVRPYVQRVAAGEHQALLGSANRLQMFAVTSGTTSESKLIPVTDRFLHDYRRGWQMWGIGTYSEHVRLQKLNIVQISSSHRRFATPGGTPCGNISGLVAAMQSTIVRTLYTVPSAVAEIGDAEAKRYTILRMALADPYVGMLITANPSTLLQLLDHANQHAESLIRDIRDGGLSGCQLPESVRGLMRKRLRADRKRASVLESIVHEHGGFRPRSCWPMLGVLGVWCGGSAAAYIPRLKQQFDDVPVRDHGLHASEGRMTLPLEDNSSAGILEVQTHFFEFIPVGESESTQPVVLEAHELEEGREYFILLTTSSGLYRYNIQDVVRCVGFYGSTPILEFRHKGAHISSITGEKIAESQVVESVRTAYSLTGFSPQIYTLTPCWGEPPGYTLYVGRLSDNPANHRAAAIAARDSGGSDGGGRGPLALTAQNNVQSKFAIAVDEDLCRRNVEYGEKRHTGRLQMIRVQELSPDAWKSFTNLRQSGSGGSAEQYKHPCLMPDPQFEEKFLKACGLR
jgi:hypothetical protein